MEYINSGLKINLSLKVVGQRSDNFHLLDSIFVPIFSVHDVIGVEMAESEQLAIDFTSNIANQSHFDGMNNLAVRAAQLYCRKAELTPQIKIDLEKNIPIGGGVGGGSGNAGAILNFLNSKFKKFDTETLKKMALTLGADVPFFIENQLARVNGIGEVITPLKSAMDLYFVLIFPQFPVSTPWAFKNLPSEIKKTDVLGRNDLIVKALKNGDYDLLAANIHNDFEEILFGKYPIYQVIADSIKQYGKLSISGSGSSCFVLCRNADEQKLVYEKLRTCFADDNIVIKKVVYKK